VRNSRTTKVIYWVNVSESSGIDPPIDYCNSLLVGLPELLVGLPELLVGLPELLVGLPELLVGLPAKLLNRLQAVINTAARLVCHAMKADHITHVLKDIGLHWLRILERIQCKLCVLAFKCQHSLASP